MALLFFSGDFRKFSVDGSDPTRSWLNRDADAVRAYLKEPRCTFLFTLGGYFSFLKVIRYDNQPENHKNFPKNLPVIFLSGSDDPVGSFGKGVERAAAQLRSTGVKNVEVKLYPGARHEILNELNRMEVYEDIARWCSSKL